jgi:flagellin
MAFSVNTNEGALVALQSLTKTTSNLSMVQNRINTGLKVASAKDNAAVFNIAQKLRSNLSGLSAVQQSIDRSQGSIDVAIAAGEAVSGLLLQMKEKAVAAKDPGLDSASRTSLNDEFKELRDQITTIVDNATFNGTNAVKTNAIVSVLNEDASKTLTIAAQNMSLGSSIVTVTAAQSIGGTTAAGTALTNITASITNVGASLAKFGAGSKRLAIQKEFSTKLADAIEVGIGNMVDADLAKESANLQALQVKQQLGLQALSIANQAPGAVLALFG